MAELFKVNLGGIIDLLSNHLYSTPGVYLREMLQNATDAITARQALSEKFDPQITVEVVDSGEVPQLVVTDNGIGLSEEEVHRFLSTIGESSKRDMETSNDDFIGRFGIGLLSCFVVTDTISLVTRSATGTPAVQWIGRADGTYSLETLEDSEIPLGTTVHLKAKASHRSWFQAQQVRDLLTYYGCMLPFPVRVRDQMDVVQINKEAPPWRSNGSRNDALVFGERLLEERFMDAIPIQSEAGGVEGVAYVLSRSPSPTEGSAHQVYLKNMLVGPRVRNLLPSWAFFVRCVINAESLRPTASREAFYEDEVLEATRLALGESLKQYLVTLRHKAPERLATLIRIHFRSIKSLCAYDDEFLSLFIDVLPFETSLGNMNFDAIRKTHKHIRYTPSVEMFRQISQIAAAQNVLVVNAGYSYDIDIFERLPVVFPSITITKVDTEAFSESLNDVESPDENLLGLVELATRVHEPFNTLCRLKSFEPGELPVLFVEGGDAKMQAMIDRTEDEVGDDGLWGDVLGSIKEELPDARPHLYLNAKNPTIRKLASGDDEEVKQTVLHTLYIQALLLGHHPLGPEHISLMNVALLDLIEWGIDSRSNKITHQ